ncbi:Cysteine desulfurase [Pirellula sp. SH-Sr6A]|uniref:aminotransferase class V-fold PLP-dependent enzyme n=1 Tax=Pirellula sp. SH-Sr6A TaxID=1632865 RepID=UPI00078D3810|nr:aminotransferase class V-fold PLP-dependent enzyme [Pirellula sp. SH-Sr6A]AMV34109.1 Cysteine desulfurase [Pirellula sp. SH-Sr6A]
MPVTREWAYFDHAAVAPLPSMAADAGRVFLNQAEKSGDCCWPEWSAIATRLRGNAASLLHCEVEEIALVPNTTFAINLIASAFPWFSSRASSPRTEAARPNVVVIENEFSSNLLPWLELARSGVEVRVVPVDPSGIVSLDRLAERIDSATRLVSISWVGYSSGYRIDLPKVCELVHCRGAELFLDAIQGLGVFSCDVSQLPIDYLAADGHKWLLGPEGAGLLYIRRERLAKLENRMVGWNSVQGAHRFQNAEVQFKSDASRFEGGSANHLGIVCLDASLRLLLDLGVHLPCSGVATAVLENADLIEESLRSLGAIVYRDKEAAQRSATHCSGIISFEIEGKDPQSIRNALIRNKVVTSVRHGRLRVATHAYNNADDVQRLCDAIRS